MKIQGNPTNFGQIYNVQTDSIQTAERYQMNITDKLNKRLNCQYYTEIIPNRKGAKLLIIPPTDRLEMECIADGISHTKYSNKSWEYNWARLKIEDNLKREMLKQKEKNAININA